MCLRIKKCERDVIREKILSCLLAATSVFGFCALSYTSSAAEVSEQHSVQESGKTNDTELVFAVDKSGPMSGLESDTTGNFNSVINEQKKDTENGKVYVTTVMFNQIHSKVDDREDIATILQWEALHFWMRLETL